jgi:hypothetical protein
MALSGAQTSPSSGRQSHVFGFLRLDAGKRQQLTEDKEAQKDRQYSVWMVGW